MRGQAGAWSQEVCTATLARVCWCVCPGRLDGRVQGALPACTVRSKAPRVDYNSFGNSLSFTSSKLEGAEGPIGRRSARRLSPCVSRG